MFHTSHRAWNVDNGFSIKHFSSIYLLFWSRNVSCCAKNRKGNKEKISSLMMKAMRRNEWYGMRHALHLLTANQISSLNKQLTDSLKGLLSSRRISHACKVVILLKIFGNTLDLPLEWLERTPQCFFVRFYKYSMRNGFSNGCDDINNLRCWGKQY